MRQRRHWAWGDVIVVLLLGGAIFGITQMSREFRSEFHSVTEIDLSLGALPLYALFSAGRGLIAYVFSLLFTFVVGYAAARSRRAEMLIIPVLDILQSVPVLGFMPGLLIAFVALFPSSEAGLEFTAILMIFTGQVWNMTFAFYGAMKTIPTELMEVSRIIGLGWRERFKRVEFPFSAVGLAWNSLMSMAGGWFFLSVCESFRLGEREYRLPGIGSYIAVATRQGDVVAIVAGMAAMVGIILAMDFVLWRPILVWVQRFRVAETEEAASGLPQESFIRIVFRESRILRWVRSFVRSRRARRIIREVTYIPEVAGTTLVRSTAPIRRALLSPQAAKWTWRLSLIAVGAGTGWASLRLLGLFGEIDVSTWIRVALSTLRTFARVLGAVVLSTLWTVPLGVWLSRTPKRLRVAQPIIQLLASFPAPMLYPLVVGLLLRSGIHFEIGSMFLLLMGVQWYILFNVLAGTTRTPAELEEVLNGISARRRTRWRSLYFPAIFPALVTGWVTAMGGAWNASIVAEYLEYRGGVLQAQGLGSLISQAAASGDFRLLAAGVTVMVAVVVAVNRLVWARMYRVAEQRFRMG
jgi:NitT/TauT family transport system permease protein